MLLNTVLRIPIDRSVVTRVRALAFSTSRANSGVKRAIVGDETRIGRMKAIKNTTLNSQLLKFVNNGQWGHGAHDSSGGFTHIGSRYEFFKDLEVDEVVKSFIADQSYNSNVEYNEQRVLDLIRKLELTGLENNFITTLSNGQFRRCRIAKELYRNYAKLLIDDPFLGLDPHSAEVVNGVLEEVAGEQNLVLGLRLQDPIPQWIEEVEIVKQGKVVASGSPQEHDVASALQDMRSTFNTKHESLVGSLKKTFRPIKYDIGPIVPIIEMDNVNVKYRGKPIIKDFSWRVMNGEKWHIRGKNGSGKTTLLSLITLDHPQSWNKTISVFGVPREVGKVNYFDTNALIGFTSPELHAIFPKNLTAFEAVTTGFVVGTYSPPRISSSERSVIEHYLDTMQIDPAAVFGQLSVSKQKMVLLMRALINRPKIVILDEALSGMTDDDVLRGKYLVDSWPGTCLIIGHVKDEVPRCDKYLVVDNISEGTTSKGTL